MSWLKSIFGGGPKVDFPTLVKNGAQIIDVRTKGEYIGGHVKGSVNIPLNDLPKSLTKIKKDKPVITCCASGMRSSTAKDILRSRGFEEVYNGGSWTTLNKQFY